MANSQNVQGGANNPNKILSAINGNTGGMNLFAGKFNSQQLADIAAFIAAPF
jgi:mono/diheme cytochrome c family protein